VKVDRLYRGVKMTQDSAQVRQTGMWEGPRPSSMQQRFLWRNSPSALGQPRCARHGRGATATLSLCASARCVIACLYARLRSGRSRIALHLPTCPSISAASNVHIQRLPFPSSSSLTSTPRDPPSISFTGPHFSRKRCWALAPRYGEPRTHYSNSQLTSSYPATRTPQHTTPAITSTRRNHHPSHGPSGGRQRRPACRSPAERKCSGPADPPGPQSCPTTPEARLAPPAPRPDQGRVRDCSW
jgi:hypothetical protein